jgi:chromosome segregation ATPase
MSPVLQNTPNMSWLDEELRKEKAIVEGLRDTIEKQQVMITDQTQRIMGLEDRLAKLQAQLLRIPEVEESIQHTRDEIVSMIADLRQEQQKREAEFLRNRQAEREQELRAIQALQVEMQQFSSLEQAVAARQAEDQRLGELIARLQQDLEGITKQISQGEEGRRRLADAIEKSGLEVKQNAQDIEEMRKHRQDTVSRLLSIENTLPRLEQQLAEIQNMRQELTAQQDELLENQRISERVRAQTMTEWGRKLEGFGQQLETWAEQLRYFTDQHEKNRRLLREIQELAQDVSQQQDRLRQLQRISEEQMQRELREWRSENDRRWAQEVERRDQPWKAQAQHNDAQERRLTTLEEGQEGLSNMLRSLEERINTLREDLVSDADKMKWVQRRAWVGFAETLQEVITEMRSAFDDDSPSR